MRAAFAPRPEPSRNPLRCAGIVLLLAAACGGLRDTSKAPRPWDSGPARSQAVPAPPTAPTPNQDPLETIARYEDAGSDGGGLLETLLERGAETTRERAALALGRLPFPESGVEVTRALCAALADASARVRAASAFSLGMRADPAATEALLAAHDDRDAGVRARVVEAASRIDEPRLRSLVLDALADPDPQVREEAAIGPHRWSKDAPDASLVDSQLMRAIEKNGTEFAWRATFTLARRASSSARAVFDAGLASDDISRRIFSAQGLRALPYDEKSQARLRTALADADWRVVCEAAGALGQHPEAASIAGLAQALEHPSPHVRRVAAEAIGAFQAEREAVRPLLERARVDASPNVRIAAIESQARLGGDEFAPEVKALADRSDPLLRAGAAAAAVRLSDEVAVPILVSLTHDPNLRVADIAARGLKEHPTKEARARILSLLENADNGLRLAAAETLGEIGEPVDLPALQRCLASTRGEIAAEVAANVVDAAAKIGGEQADLILKLGASHEDPFVRKKARAWLAKTSPTVEVPRTESRSGARPAVTLPPGIDWRTGSHPEVEIVTSRGVLVFELFRDETPVHVHNFIELARRKVYDGLTFHRVVPDFVVQGGDPRGDGNGGSSWRGAPLRREFTPRKFVRGSLGMPRNDDPDSGGGQLFVTHRSTPHLDGRYTLFGQLRTGFEVLDAIEVGDTILSVRVLNPAASR